MELSTVKHKFCYGPTYQPIGNRGLRRVPILSIRMVFIALMKMSYKQLGDMLSKLMRKNIDMISNGRHHVYTRIKKRRRVIGWDKGRAERGLDEIYFLYGGIAILTPKLSRNTQIGFWTIKIFILALELLICNSISSMPLYCSTCGQLKMQNDFPVLP